MLTKGDFRKLSIDQILPDLDKLCFAELTCKVDLPRAMKQFL